jgi:hypothetical protein
LLIFNNLNQAAKFLKYNQIIRVLSVFFLIGELKMKKYQILAQIVEQFAAGHPIVKKFAKQKARKLHNLMVEIAQNGI